MYFHTVSPSGLTPGGSLDVKILHVKTNIFPNFFKLISIGCAKPLRKVFNKHGDILTNSE